MELVWWVSSAGGRLLMLVRSADTSNVYIKVIGQMGTASVCGCGNGKVARVDKVDCCIQYD